MHGHLLRLGDRDPAVASSRRASRAPSPARRRSTRAPARRGDPARRLRFQPAGREPPTASSARHLGAARAERSATPPRCCRRSATRRAWARGLLLNNPATTGVRGLDVARRARPLRAMLRRAVERQRRGCRHPDAIRADADVTDVRWAAYMLATVRHECADRWQPIEEFGKGGGATTAAACEVKGGTGRHATLLRPRLRAADVGLQLPRQRPGARHRRRAAHPPREALDPTTATASCRTACARAASPADRLAQVHRRRRLRLSERARDHQRPDQASASRATPHAWRRCCWRASRPRTAWRWTRRPPRRRAPCDRGAGRRPRGASRVASRARWPSRSPPAPRGPTRRPRSTRATSRRRRPPGRPPSRPPRPPARSATARRGARPGLVGRVRAGVRAGRGARHRGRAVPAPRRPAARAGRLRAGRLPGQLRRTSRGRRRRPDRAGAARIPRLVDSGEDTGAAACSPSGRSRCTACPPSSPRRPPARAPPLPRRRRLRRGADLRLDHPAPTLAELRGKLACDGDASVPPERWPRLEPSR